MSRTRTARSEPKKFTATSETDSGVLNSPSVRKIVSTPPSETLPMGTFIELDATRAAICCMLTSKRSSFFLSTRTWISRLRPPTTSTSPTPARRSSCGFTTRSAMSKSSVGEACAVSASRTIGWSAGSIRRMSGSWISLGRLLRAACNRPRTCCSASLMSVPNLNSITTIETLSRFVDESWFKPGSEPISSSIGLETSDSTS